MMLARQGLGMIPAWQFSQDPAVNPNINPNVVFPDGWTQSTVQPQGAFYAPPTPNLGGLGRSMFMRSARAYEPINPCCGNCSCGGGDPCCGQNRSLHGWVDDITSPLTDVACQASFICRNKWWFLAGGAGLVALAAFGGAGMLKR
jgi:hypothetical protein